MSHTFLPWLREGIAGDLTAAGIQSGQLSGKLTLLINGTEVEDPATEGSLRVRLLGPGDVTGFNRRLLVVRTDPPDLSSNVEPNYFPFIEFDVPSFPWLFTPTAPDGNNRLRPWLVLIVVRRQDGVEVRQRNEVEAGADPNNKVSILTIQPPAVAADELPDLGESWAWAHVQVTGKVSGEELKRVLAKEPARTLARLICPRRLRSLTSYYACVVPAYQDGVDAALGRSPSTSEDGDVRDAWSSESLKDANPLTLPVFHHWEFSTGERGDFEALARTLAAAVARPPTPEEQQALGRVGRRRVDLSAAGFQLPPTAPAVIDLEGALRVPGGEPEPRPDWFAAKMTELLQDTTTRAVHPPAYGATQAGADSVIGAGWLDELNLDPRHRAAAGLGARVVREQQERLMEAAWAQAGDLPAVNQIRVRIQHAQAVNEPLWRRLKPLAESPSTAGALLQRIAPARLPGGSVRAQLEGSALVSPAYRRLTRSRGPIGRRFPSPEFSTGDLQGIIGTRPTMPDALVDQLNPGRTHAVQAARPPEQPQFTARADSVAPLVYPPKFPAPMVVELQRLGADYLLPGVEHLPPESALLLEPNRPFVAAFLAGLNHEMSRELLWREYPTDPAATYFQVFWDRRGYIRPDTADEQGDIGPIDQWDGALGNAVRESSDGELVLVMRSQLVRRFPRPVVSAVRADPGSPRRALANPDVAGNTRLPLYTGFIDPDIMFFGLPLSEENARRDNGGLGWFIVLQEQPSEPRFGLDESSRFLEGQPETWKDLAWGHLVASQEEFEALTHVPVLTARPAKENWSFERPSPLPSTPARWSGGAADLAALTRQFPARVAIHAELLLPKTG